MARAVVPLLVLLAALVGAGTAAGSAACRDRRTWPFAATSVWNMPIGSAARLAPARLFPNTTALPLPHNVNGDADYFFAVAAGDPLTPLYDQGWWGQPTNHCRIVGPLYTHLRFPHSAVVTNRDNNAAALLQPDNVTLLQTQPLYRCAPGSPLFALGGQVLKYSESILGPGISGAHGGSHLSSIGGTIRLGELLPSAPPIRHSLKLELFARQYYYGGEDVPCFLWPASGCDGYAHNDKSALRYNGTDRNVRPGTLLAVPSDLAAGLALKTVPGRKILAALTSYGGYLCDDTAANRATMCTEAGVKDEFAAAYGYPFEAGPSSAGAGADFYADITAVFQALHAVTNNGPDSVGGGGTPSQPLAPPICGA